MNVKLLQEKLIRAARHAGVSDAVPYAFEKRVLACIRAERLVDGVTLWARALWRAAIPCTLLMLVLGLVTINLPMPSPPSAQTDSLSAELETTLMASVSLDNNFSW